MQSDERTRSPKRTMIRRRLSSFGLRPCDESDGYTELRIFRLNSMHIYIANEIWNRL